MVAENKGRASVKRCAIYIRVSTAMQRMEGWSLDAQRAALTALAKSKGWKVVGVYADEGKSARKRLKDRREIHRLLDDVRAGLIDVILFKELDRWFRNISDFYKVQDVLDAHGVKWFSQQQPGLEMETKEGRLQVNVLLSVGQNEADATSDRIKYTNRFMRQQRRWTSGPGTLPRGYTVDSEQRVIIDKKEEPFVRAFLAGVVRYGNIKAALVEANSLTAKPMLYNNAAELLKKPMLYGEYKGIPDFVERPYMTRKEWEHMQSCIKRNARGDVSHFYIFSGLLVCACCGRRMAGNATTKDGKVYRYYRCNHYAQNGACDNRLRGREHKIEAALLEYVREAVADKIVQVEQVTAEQARRKPRKSNRADIERQLDRLDDIYITGGRMTKEKYEARKAAIMAKLVEEPEAEPLPAVADLQQIQALFDGGALELYAGFTPEEKREFWLAIVERVDVEGTEVKGVEFLKAPGV